MSLLFLPCSCVLQLRASYTNNVIRILKRCASVPPKILHLCLRPLPQSPSDFHCRGPPRPRRYPRSAAEPSDCSQIHKRCQRGNPCRAWWRYLGRRATICINIKISTFVSNYLLCFKLMHIYFRPALYFCKSLTYVMLGKWVAQHPQRFVPETSIHAVSGINIQ